MRSLYFKVKNISNLCQKKTYWIFPINQRMIPLNMIEELLSSIMLRLIEWLCFYFWGIQINKRVEGLISRTFFFDSSPKLIKLSLPKNLLIQIFDLLKSLMLPTNRCISCEEHLNLIVRIRQIREFVVPISFSTTKVQLVKKIIVILSKSYMAKIKRFSISKLNKLDFHLRIPFYNRHCRLKYLFRIGVRII